LLSRWTAAELRELQPHDRHLRVSKRKGRTGTKRSRKISTTTTRDREIFVHGNRMGKEGDRPNEFSLRGKKEKKKRRESREKEHGIRTYLSATRLRADRARYKNQVLQIRRFGALRRGRAKKGGQRRGTVACTTKTKEAKAQKGLTTGCLSEGGMLHVADLPERKTRPRRAKDSGTNRRRGATRSLRSTSWQKGEKRASTEKRGD